MNEIRNERGEITTDNKEIQRILSKYYEPLYANKLDKMNKFLKALIFIKLNQEESENLIRQISPIEIEAVIKKLPKNKSPRLDGFTGEFYQLFQELTPLLLKLILKNSS